MSKCVLDIGMISRTSLRLDRAGLTSESASTQRMVLIQRHSNVEMRPGEWGCTEGREKTGFTVAIRVAVISHFDGRIDGTATEGKGVLFHE